MRTYDKRHAIWLQLQSWRLQSQINLHMNSIRLFPDETIFISRLPIWTIFELTVRFYAILRDVDYM